ncbi:MAG TPA: DinB family protein [Longimicrobiales bacterium]|nr:DinB family protein [Longimicrobiales bacterium]
MPEAWLTGPVTGIPRELMPAAHMLLQSRAELANAASSLSANELWATPGGAASVGFHLRHLAGSIDRLLTYARAEPLSAAQMSALKEEKTPDPTLDASRALHLATSAIDRALQVYRTVDPTTLLDDRTVGRAQLPSSVIGLLYHIAEHTVRHTGQIIVTAKVAQT